MNTLKSSGIHTDGHDHSMLLCLSRENITGAENSIYHDMEGKDVFMDDFVLKEGSALLWEDNKVFHYVNPASLIDVKKEGVRTMMLLGYPAYWVITGGTNPNNTLGPKDSDAELQQRKNQQLAQEWKASTGN